MVVFLDEPTRNQQHGEGKFSRREDLASGERSAGIPQNADPAGPSIRFSAPSTLSQQRAAPFTRYWQQPAAPTSPAPNQARKSEPRAPQAGTSSAMDVFQSPISSNAITTIEILKTDEYVVELQSSDEDEVVEVALPPKPTITIESSDEELPPPPVDNIISTPKNSTPPKEKLRAATDTKKNKKKQKNKRRAASASPVPSVVSSISDDFIRGDCAAFNISRRPEVERFNFNLHGADLLDQHSNSLSHKINKKKKKKNKDKSGTTTPTRGDAAPPSAPELNQCFTTPDNNAKRKSKKNYKVSERSIPDPDVYESDSNQSALIENAPETVAPALNTGKDTENITEALAPPAAATTTAEPHQPPPVEEIVESTHQQMDSMNQDVELIENPIPVEDNLVMGNVTGLTPVTDSSLLHISRGNRFRNSPNTLSIEHSAVLPQTPMDSEVQGIKTMHTSRHSCREEMERFYNESWGGEEFDHYKILRDMPRDKSLWTIDRRDRILPSANKRQCHYCNQVGHSYDRCRLKPRICHMCGSHGHYEPRCPKRMCLRCGAPNSIYSIHCRVCSTWNRICCDICKMFGHPVEHCPDLWRRYHNTVENNGIIIRQSWQKKREDLFCSGCTRRGHLVHSCRSLPFSALPLYSPFVFHHTPVYPPAPNTQYPTVGPSGRYFTLAEEHESGDKPHHQHVQDNQIGPYQNNPSLTGGNNQQTALAQNPPAPSDETLPRDALKCPPQSSDNPDLSKKRNISCSEISTQKDLYVITSTTERNEAVLQDSEVSNTSEVVTTAKIYIEKVVMEELKKEGMDWLVETSARHRVQVILEERPTTFVNISGLPADQEAFQTELKEWVRRCTHRKESLHLADTPVENEKAETNIQNLCQDIPQNKYKLLRMLNQALTFLQSDLGDPKTIYKELQYLTKLHNKLLKNKVISPKKLRNSRQKLSVALKNLNTILLGQAGLAGGSRHVRELYSLQGILTRYRKHDLPYELRHKVGEHFHFVFSTVARDDYSILMNKYYQTNANLPSDQPKTSLQSPGNKTKLNRKQRKKVNRALAVNQVPVDKQAPLINQTNSKKKMQPFFGTREYTFKMDQINSLQKKLRKENGGSEHKQQWRQALLKKLRKFQIIGKNGLSPEQFVRLNKLLSKVTIFMRN